MYKSFKSSLFLLLYLLFFGLQSCAELQQFSEEMAKSQGISNQQIANGLKEALTKGVDQQVTQLTEDSGFYSRQLVRIGFPEELDAVESGLRTVGLGHLADEGIKALNTTAEQAVKEATPILISAIQQMSFDEARQVLLGGPTEATAYLKSKTEVDLYKKFQPIVEANFKKVGADRIWETTIQRYNQIPFTQNVDPDLTNYVTSKALSGVFKMIEIEEKEIRDNINERTSDLLRRVFALQD